MNENDAYYVPDVFLDNDAMIVDSPPAEQPTVVSWGRSDLGCLLKKKDSEMKDGFSFSPSDTRNFVSVASNSYHTAALTATGELYCCGQNDEGQLGLIESSPVVDKLQLVESMGNHQVISVACGLMHTVCITASGCAISFGSNESGQLGHTPEKMSKVAPKVVNFSFPPRKNAMIITKVACGDLFSLFLTTSGEVFGCGSASFLGNLPNSNRLIASQAERVEALVGTNIVDVVAGSSHALALSTSGELYGWGSNRHFELGIEQPSNTNAQSTNNPQDELFHEQIPKVIPLQTKAPAEQIVGLAAGYSHSLFWTSKGILFGTGANKYGQLALPYPRVEKFEQIPLPFFVVMAACGSNHTLVLCNGTPEVNSGKITREDSHLGNPLSRINSFTAAASAGLIGSGLVSPASAKSTNDVANACFSKVYGFGGNSFGQVSSTNPSSMLRTPLEILDLANIMKVNKVLYVSAGGDQSFAIGVGDVQGKSSSSASLCQESKLLLKKQFSSLVSKAVVPMGAKSILNLIKKCTVSTSQSTSTSSAEPEIDQRLMGITLSTICEIFSSPSLLAGSFKQDEHSTLSSSSTSLFASSSYSIDVEGVEAVYGGILSLGAHATARLLGAIQQSITELERALSSSVNLHLPESSIRVFLILWQSPIFSNPMMSSDLFLRLLKIVASHSHALIEMISLYYPSHIFASRLLKPCHDQLDYYVNTEGSNVQAAAIIVLCQTFQWLYNANQKMKFVSTELFYNHTLSNLPDQILVKDYIGWRQNLEKQKQESKDPNNNSQSKDNQNEIKYFFFSDYAFLFSALAKRRILFAENSLQQQAAQQQAVTHGILFGAGFIYPWFVISVERAHLLQQALLHIANASPMDLKKPLKVVFIGEEGVDEGGVRKEFFQLLIQQLFNLEFGMFVPIQDSRSIWLNKDNHWSADEYSLVGSLLGLALYNGILLNIHFPTFFYKKLLQMPLEFEDLKSIDLEFHRGLTQLLNYSPKEDIEHVFCRTFSLEYDEYGAKKTVELIPNGQNIPVTHENYQLYADKLVEWLLKDSVTEQFNALYGGFTKVINPSSLLLLKPEELELLMVGTPHLDFKELENTTEYIGEVSWNAENQTIKWFWEIIQTNLSFEEKQKFLFFVTGSNRAPLGGLKNIGLKIQRMGPDSEQLPTAHTCFNVLLLPEYSAKEKVENRLRKAINECEGFGLK
jgi:alpha-tubulin suppressor-like RCC1 family protein